MNRRHLFEIHELAACPQIVRELLTGFLETITVLFRPYSLKTDVMVRAMRSTGTQQFVDLCSGNGGPWFHLFREIEQETGKPISVVLTDKFPSRDARRRTELLDGLTYLSDPVDARCVPESLGGVRTLFNGLHHFQPGDAKAVLQDAVSNGQPIAVFELLQRNGLMLVHAFLLPISVLLLTPLVRPLSWWRLVLTYVIPLASLILLWDGVVSALRCYRPEELRAMADELVGETYHWETGSYWRWAAPVTYMIGYPIGGVATDSPRDDA